MERLAWLEVVIANIDPRVRPSLPPPLPQTTPILASIEYQS